MRIHCIRIVRIYYIDYYYDYCVMNYFVAYEPNHKLVILKLVSSVTLQNKC